MIFTPPLPQQAPLCITGSEMQLKVNPRLRRKKHVSIFINSENNNEIQLFCEMFENNKTKMEIAPGSVKNTLKLKM